MNLLKSIVGMVAVQIISADIVRTLDAINRSDIQVFHVSQIDDLTVQVQIYRRDFRVLKSIAIQKGAKIQLVRRQGIYWLGKGLLIRPWLIAGLLFLAALTMYLPTRILFIEVEGNTTIPAKLILEQANACGISFGASRREVRSERVKNNLLGAIPQLQWAGVNTYGCTAVISVTERTASQTSEQEHGVSSIIAARDGVIISCTVTKGNALCKTGLAVKAGEVLVSGYTDCGLSIQASRAEAEIVAQTMRDITAVTPLLYVQRGQQTVEKKYYSLIIGKKEISLTSETGADTGYSCKTRYEYPLMLPGGYTLPMVLVVETVRYYEYNETVLPDEAAASLLNQYARSYLDQTMVGGQIIGEHSTFTAQDSTGILSGAYVCQEIIGVERMETQMQGTN